MTRAKVKTYRYRCDGMKPVTHAEDGREYTVPMSTLCGFEADFQGADGWCADVAAQRAGWVITDGSHYCQMSHTPWYQEGP